MADRVQVRTGETRQLRAPGGEVAQWMSDAGFDQTQEIDGIFPQRNKWVIAYSRKGQ